MADLWNDPEFNQWINNEIKRGHFPSSADILGWIEARASINIDRDDEVAASEPDITVSITDTEFTVGELQEFLDTIRGIDGMPANALVILSVVAEDIAEWTLTATTAHRNKYDG